MKKNKLKVCIFGSTSHISKGLISNFLKNGEPTLHLYTRSADKLRCHLESAHKTGDKSFVIHDGYNDFLKGSYDVIINCVGVGSPNKLQGNHSEHFVVIEKYDNLIIRYLLKNPATSYISFSSGAVYGGGFSSAVSENTLNSILVNHVSAENYYSIAKFYSETKHRSFKNLKIAYPTAKLSVCNGCNHGLTSFKRLYLSGPEP